MFSVIIIYFYCTGKIIHLIIHVKQSNPYAGLDRSLGLQQVEAPRYSRQSAHEGGKFVSPTRRPPDKVVRNRSVS